MGALCTAGIIALAIVGVVIAGAVIHQRERHAKKNGNGFDQLSELTKR